MITVGFSNGFGEGLGVGEIFRVCPKLLKQNKLTKTAAYINFLFIVPSRNYKLDLLLKQISNRQVIIDYER